MPKRRASPEATSPSKREKLEGEPSTDASGGPDRPSSISAERRKALLAQYPACIPDKLAELDEQRFSTIPASIASRTDGESGRHLIKAEFIKLVEWKLKHGTFRPALLGMAKQHPEVLVISTTSEAFALIEDPMAALKVLVALRGIGPATASLFLSCADDKIPFFSDELFRWMLWDEPGGGGWSRKIKYTDKEYRALIEKVKEVLEGQEGLTAWDLEKMAYVLARE